MSFIYKLVFPNDERVYIGQTTRELKHRLVEHTKALVNGVHHSKKLQRAYPQCGTPSIQILCNCTKEELNNKEIFYIQQYNSLHGGFNHTRGGEGFGSGEDSPSAKYNLEDYSCIVTFLALTNYTTDEISSETGVSSGVIDSIACQASHNYLSEVCPNEYTKMINKNRLCKVQWIDVISPEGLVYTVNNAKVFAETHGLEPNNFRKVLHGYSNSHLGWRRVDKPEPPSRPSGDIVSPEGTKRHISVNTNITLFATQHNLDQSALRRLLLGINKTHKGWTLLKGTNASN